MATAVRKVHLQNGVWNSKGGWEFNAVLAAAVAAVASDGPGVLSFDALLGRSRWGIGGALFALGAAASRARTPSPSTRSACSRASRRRRRRLRAA